MSEHDAPLRWDQAVFDGDYIRVTLPRAYLSGDLWLTDSNVRQVMPNMPFPEAFEKCIVELFRTCAVDFVGIRNDQLYLRPPIAHPTAGRRLSRVERIELFRLGLQDATGQTIPLLRPEEMLPAGNEMAFGTTGVKVMRIIHALCSE